jgi:hypothetical protein
VLECLRFALLSRVSESLTVTADSESPTVTAKPSFRPSDSSLFDFLSYSESVGIGCGQPEGSV